VSQLMLALDAPQEIVDIVSDDHDLNDDVHMLAAIDLTIAQDITPDVAQQ
jgi:hypothetical protein